MIFKKYNTKEEFLKENLDILLEKEPNNEVMIGITLQHESNKVNNWLLGRLEDNGKIIAIFIVDDDKEGLIVYFTEENVKKEYLEFLVSNIVSLNINLKEIVTIQNFAKEIANIYIEKTKKEIKKQEIIDILVINKIKEEHVLNENEKLIKLDSEKADMDKMSQIVKDIHSDIYNVEECSDEEAYKIAKIYLKKGLYVLTDTDEKEIYCHAVVVRKQINGCAIGAVISPKEYRGKGYGKKCIYSLCKELLKENKFVVLHVADTNKAARTVYEKIGFEMIERSERIKFK